MREVLDFIKANSHIFIIATMILNTILFALLLLNYNVTSNLKDKYKRLVKGTSNKNIEGILHENMDKIEEVNKELDRLKNKANILDNRLSFCIQKIGIIRYSAFNDTGSDLSFSIALLDNNDDGIIMTGIHGRSESITYAKPIKEGKSSYSLSIEEIQALDRAKDNTIDGRDIKGSRRSKEVS
ncbi:DUF4446 family protein [Alkaliphilus pronyensis]|uniref:DUF4446 family protein n=1 Tax=Alkaliphilus pronyensis TaxID=1482732 RepID=A0A6I0F8S5_9FIRM|nr:DUF4446 family protein [Alkaliphilus pronyensis]KAB3531880.1 DUF4446 family protein [Alkaliphilus pronyensis]